MSTLAEKIRAQKMALEHQPVQPWHRHLVGPEELEMLLSDKAPEPISGKAKCPFCGSAAGESTGHPIG
jgi:hypothetical protein